MNIHSHFAKFSHEELPNLKSTSPALTNVWSMDAHTAQFQLILVA